MPPPHADAPRPTTATIDDDDAVLLIFSDLHLDNYRRLSVTTQYGINSRLWEQIQVIGRLITIAQKLKPEAIIFLGDWFNGQGASINKLLFIMGFDLVEQLSRVAPLYLIVGNHDVYGNSHILTPFSEFENVVVVYDVRHETFMGMDVAMTPWGGLIPKGGDILLGHFDITGFKTGLGYELPGTIDPKELKNFKLVVSGHYHSYQEPHSEVAALAIFLDRYRKGKSLEKDFKGRLRIVPNPRGKTVVDQGKGKGPRAPK